MINGISRPAAIFAEKQLMRYAKMRLSSGQPSNERFLDAGLRDLFKPLSKDVFSNP
jgi:hypothetical protein